MHPPFLDDSFDVTAGLFGTPDQSETFPIHIRGGVIRVTSNTDGGYVELDPDTGDLRTVTLRVAANLNAPEVETVHQWTELPFYELLAD